MPQGCGERENKMNESKMTSSVVMVDPVLASQWLAKNVGNNRKMRPWTVEVYADTMRRGEWQLTHQGVAFDSDGNLIDGQHRLSAIVEARVPVLMVVTFNAPPVSFAALDCGIKRSISDRLAMDPRLGAALASAEELCGSQRLSRTASHIQSMRESAFGAAVHGILDASNKTSKRLMSSTWVLIPAAVAVVEGEDLEWVCEQRRVLIAQDEERETPVASAFRRRFQERRAKATPIGNLDIVACALRVFERRSSEMKMFKLFSGWEDATHARVRAAVKKGAV